MVLRPPRVPYKFISPIVKKPSQGIPAFYAYDWYYKWMARYMTDVKKVFLTPCAATKPIYSSMFHRGIYQKFITALGGGSEILVVSEPVVLIRYCDLYNLKNAFLYDFPPKMLSPESREFFVSRLKRLLSGKIISGCLPRHHASLINDAVGNDWKNYWQGDIYRMMKKASSLHPGLDSVHSHSIYRAQALIDIIGLTKKITVTR